MPALARRIGHAAPLTQESGEEKEETRSRLENALVVDGRACFVDALATLTSASPQNAMPSRGSIALARRLSREG